MADNELPPAASPVGGGPPARWRRRALLLLALVLFLGFMWLTTEPPRRPPAPKPNSGTEEPGQIGRPFEPVPPPPEPARPALPAKPAIPATALPIAPPYRPAPLMAFGGPAETMQPGPAMAGPGRREDGAGPFPPAVEPAAAAVLQADPLAARLRADDQPVAVATRLPDRNLVLTEGTPIPCLPDAPITSDIEGAFRCKVPAAVYATSGAVALLDPGTWIVGRVGAGLRRGQRRLFAVMTRIETPQGCVVRLRAPVADALGQAGLDGDIDTHFFERFSAYLGMAFLDTALQAAVLAASNAGGRNNGFQFYQFQQAGREGGQALFADQAAIPSTLSRGQAMPIVVRLTQDIDMRACFRLRAREAGR
ncbi:TrbI/VirB10 family protein (plasmid) [Rhodovastum atsumiense]|uniref:TrbI/VirB10 family protein n=1 Tax=Rhodovastum atsumiense TaxID=504468 RepID=A0A5M6INW1_9PROT|nr:TrbI/VirB10 family protein [Rhodovastum atsumiense]KAA5609599.1 TrbI/VirB10 family protein [Rhodovastum atsumiense]CAH2606365.1 TrbI/VirB10 family protein [Rhodovastum atsumiense]